MWQMQSLRETSPTASGQFCSQKRKLWQRTTVHPSLSLLNSNPLSLALPQPAFCPSHHQNDAYPIINKDIRRKDEPGKETFDLIQESYPWMSDLSISSSSISASCQLSIFLLALGRCSLIPAAQPWASGTSLTSIYVFPSSKSIVKTNIETAYI